MTEATLLALGSAFLHAAWNLLIKTSDERFLAAWGQFLLGGLLFVPVLFVVGLPGMDVVPLLAATLVLGVFMFQIREQFDSLDIRHLEKLKDS